MIVIGITGPIGHGKTTFANALASQESSHCHLEANMPIIEVANALHAQLTTIPAPGDLAGINSWIANLPEILQQLLQVKSTPEQLRFDDAAVQNFPVKYQKLQLHLENLLSNPDLAKQQITQENKDRYRPFLQWLGGYLVEKVDPGIWFHDIVKRVRDTKVSGCELCIVGGLRYPSDAEILRTTHAKIIKVLRPGYLQGDIKDPTERERENIQPDVTVINGGTLQELEACAHRIYNDLKSGELQQTYEAHEA